MHLLRFHRLGREPYQTLQASTKVKLGATAGLRLLPEGKADVILGEVRKFLRTYPFQLDSELGVTILDGGVFPLPGGPAVGAHMRLMKRLAGGRHVGGANGGCRGLFAIQISNVARCHSLLNVPYCRCQTWKFRGAPLERLGHKGITCGLHQSISWKGLAWGHPSMRVGPGADEGAFAWLTLNYLLGRLGEEEGKTIAAIDLGGGSVQQARAQCPSPAPHSLLQAL